MKVGIVGAGIAGLACANLLRTKGIDVRLFDKGRKPGGRTSTLELCDMAWDFGAPCLTATGADFQEQVSAWARAGLLAPWPGGPAGALVGVPSMSTLVEHQRLSHDARFGALVQKIETDGASWYVAGPSLYDGPFAAIAIATPAEQAVSLLAPHDPGMAYEPAMARSRPCWTLMAAFSEPLAGLPDFLPEDGDIALAARNNSKPGRGPAECWVVQASTDWSARHLHRTGAAVAMDLFLLFERLAGARLPHPSFLKAHRWRYAHGNGRRCQSLWNPELRLGTCGDWCSGSQIEDAWRSGRNLAEKIAGRLIGPANDGSRADETVTV